MFICLAICLPVNFFGPRVYISVFMALYSWLVLWVARQTRMSIGPSDGQSVGRSGSRVFSRWFGVRTVFCISVSLSFFSIYFLGRDPARPWGSSRCPPNSRASETTPNPSGSTRRAPPRGPPSPGWSPPAVTTPHAPPRRLHPLHCRGGETVDRCERINTSDLSLDLDSILYKKTSPAR